jgi:hypothetical protein
MGTCGKFTLKSVCFLFEAEENKASLLFILCIVFFSMLIHFQLKPHSQLNHAMVFVQLNISYWIE